MLNLNRTSLVIINWLLGSLIFYFPVICYAAETAHKTKHNSQLEVTKKPGVIIFYQKDNKQLQQFLNILTRQLQEKEPKLTLHLVDTSEHSKYSLNSYLKQLSKSDIENIAAFSIGKLATQKALAQRSKIKFIGLHLSRTNLDKFHQVYKRLGVYITGIYLEQSFQRQIYLAQSIQPKMNKTAMFFGQNDRFNLNECQQIITKNKLDFNFRILQANDTPNKHLQYICKKDSFLFISNNPLVYNAINFKSLTLKAYQSQVAMIGNRINDIQSGALASIYTSQEQMANEAINLIKLILEKKPLEKPHYAKTFDIAINTSISNHLGYINLDTEKLLAQIHLMENQLNKKEHL